MHALLRERPALGPIYCLAILELSWITALSPSAAIAQEKPSPSLTQPVVSQVVVVFKTHFDIGYTDMASNVVRRYRTTMIDEALKVVEKNRDLPPEQQFAWTIPGWPMKQITDDWEGQVTERKQKVLQAFKEGRFVVHALPFTTHTELLELEDLVRGLGFASRLSRAVGLGLPRDAKMTDVPCHSWVMPTLLKQAGVDFLHLGCNAASSSPQVPRIFWWEGPDGSRLLTMYTAESYGTGLVPPKDWPYKTWLALIHTGDNHGPPTPGEVKTLLEEAKAKLPGVKVRIGRLSDFADAIIAERAEIPVVRGDMPDTWIHGPMCDPAGARLAKNIRPVIAAAESLSTLLGAWGVKPPEAAETVAKSYEQSLLYGEHTWGGALYWVTKYGSGTKWGYGKSWRTDHEQGRFQRLEGSWAEHTAYIEAARDLISLLNDSELSALAKSTQPGGWRVTVFNPLPWRRGGLVSARGEMPELSALRPVEGGEAIPVWSVGGALRFVAPDVPPMGYRAFAAVKADLPAPDLRGDTKAATIESPFFKAMLDASRGAITSLVDKRSGRELVDNSASCRFGQYLYERFDSNQVAAYVKAYVKINADWAINELGKPSLPPAAEVPYRAVSPAGATLSIEQSPRSIIATMRAAASESLPHVVTTRLILHVDQPHADWEVTLDQKPADPWPEAGWICLPFKIDAPQFRLGRQGSVIDPVKDIVRGANRNLLGINTGVALFDRRGRGVGICPIDNPLVSLDEPGCWKYALDFVPKKPVVYVNLFNNQWTTNFRLWNQGTWTARVRLWTFDRYDAESALITPSLDARFPLQAAVADGTGGKIPATQPGLELSRKGISVTAFGANPDGKGTVLRLWELAGKSGFCEVRLPKGMEVKTVQPVNLRGQPQGESITVEDRSFKVDLRAFAPASFVIGDR